jgi:outer membrane protein assembly factor BamE
MRQPFSLFTPMLKILLPLFILCGLLLAGCGSSAPSIKPFKMDIQQGNVVTSKMLLQLKPGMTKSQVRFIMGTPLIVDSFHKDRWDYFYQMRQAGKIVEQRRVILDFEKELLVKVRGDVVPQGAPGAAVDEAPAANAPITVEPKPKETTMWDKLKFWNKDEKVVAKPDVAPAVTVPVEAAVAVLPAVVAATEPQIEAAKPEAAQAEMVKPEVADAAAEKSLIEKLKFWKKDEQAITQSVEVDAPLVAPPAATAAEIKDAAAKVDITNEAATANSVSDKTMPEKSASESSWLDKLKFWKKNELTETEKAALEAAIAESSTKVAPSVVTVPIELPSTEQTSAEQAIPAAAKVETLKEESVEIETLRTEPYEATQKPTITGKDSMKPLQSPSQKMLPGKPKPLKPMPEKPAVPSSVFNKPPLEKPAPVESQLSRPLKPLPLSANNGEQLIFRMDKTLDLERGYA